MMTTELKERLTYFFDKSLGDWEDFECSGFTDPYQLVSLAISKFNLAEGINPDEDEETYETIYDEVCTVFEEASSWFFEPCEEEDEETEEED